MQWDELRDSTDADIQVLADRQNRKQGFFSGSREDNTLTLSVHEGTLSDVGATLISQLPDLEDLALHDEFEVDERGFAVTSRGWQVLSTCKKLKRLALVNCPLTVDDVHALAGLTALDNLTLTHCDLTDAHIEQLLPLKRLTYLCLNLNELTDASIQYLMCFKRLTILHLANNAFSAPGATEMDELLPKCHVQFT